VVVALEERDPQLPFPFADLLGERGLGRVRGLGGTGEVRFPGDGPEALELP